MTDSNSGSTADKRPYLGDPQTIGKLLQSIARETIQCRIASGQNILSPEDAASIEEKEATNAARALLGRDRKYAVDSTWNVPGVIDNFLKNELNLQQKGSEPLLVEGLLKFIREVHERLDLLQNPKQDPSAEGRVQDIIEKYKNLLLGLSAATPEVPSAPAPLAVAPAVIPSTQVVEPAPIPPTVAAAPPSPAPKIEPIVATAPPAPKAPRKTEAPAKAVVTEFPEPKKSGGGLKWAALFLLLAVIGATTFFIVKKPAPIPEPAPIVVEKPVAPKIIGAAPVLNSSGTIDLIEASGKTIKTITMQEDRKVGHLYDFVRINGKSSFLIATESPEEALDLWWIDESGAGRQIYRGVNDAKFSSDASKIAYTTSGHILIVEDADGTQIATARGAFDLTWVPENNAVIFLKVRDGYAVTHPDAMELCKLRLADQTVEIVVSGLYDNVMPIMQPSGKFILLVAGHETGLPSFWKIAQDGGQPVQVTNVRLDESDDAWVPTPFSTAQWSADGRWLLYDFKDGAVEQIWGIEFDDAGDLKRSTRIADGLVPRWIESDKFVYLKQVNGSFEANVQTLPAL
ncbi:MAG: hypothetical protein H0X66_16350 [Verrucomicrobia bacterium]|nr:hypothetical protein [Verrucomicrobiota bacterium]